MVEQIKRLCSEHKTSIKALEKELGFGNGTIRRWDKNTPSIERIKLVASRFNVPISYILGWDDAVSSLTEAGMSEIDVAQEMGIDPSVLQSILSGNDISSAEAVSKFITVASLLAQKEKPTLQTESERIPNYSKLSDTNKAIVDSMIAQLLAAQLED